MSTCRSVLRNLRVHRAEARAHVASMLWTETSGTRRRPGAHPRPGAMLRGPPTPGPAIRQHKTSVNWGNPCVGEPAAGTKFGLLYEIAIGQSRGTTAARACIYKSVSALYSNRRARRRRQLGGAILNCHGAGSGAPRQRAPESPREPQRVAESPREPRRGWPAGFLAGWLAAG